MSAAGGSSRAAGERNSCKAPVHLENSGLCCPPRRGHVGIRTLNQCPDQAGVQGGSGTRVSHRIWWGAASGTGCSPSQGARAGADGQWGQSIVLAGPRLQAQTELMAWTQAREHLILTLRGGAYQTRNQKTGQCALTLSSVSSDR